MTGARRFCHLHAQPHLPVAQQRQRGSERNLAAIDDCANYRIEDIHPVFIQRTEQSVQREGIDRRSNTVDLDRPRLGEPRWQHLSARLSRILERPLQRSDVFRHHQSDFDNRKAVLLDEVDHVLLQEQQTLGYGRISARHLRILIHEHSKRSPFKKQPK